MARLDELWRGVDGPGLPPGPPGSGKTPTAEKLSQELERRGVPPTSVPRKL